MMSIFDLCVYFIQIRRLCLSYYSRWLSFMPHIYVIELKPDIRFFYKISPFFNDASNSHNDQYLFTRYQCCQREIGESEPKDRQKNALRNFSICGVEGINVFFFKCRICFKSPRFPNGAVATFSSTYCI